MDQKTTILDLIAQDGLAIGNRDLARAHDTPYLREGV